MQDALKTFFCRLAQVALYACESVAGLGHCCCPPAAVAVVVAAAAGQPAVGPRQCVEQFLSSGDMRGNIVFSTCRQAALLIPPTARNIPRVSVSQRPM